MCKMVSSCFTEYHQHWLDRQRLIVSWSIDIDIRLIAALSRFQRGGRSRGNKGTPKEKLSVVMEEDATSVCDYDDAASSSSSDLDPANDFDDVQPEEMEVDEEIQLHIMGLTGYFTSVVETNFASKIKCLPTRYLLTGNIKMLWHQFCVTHSVSYLHFWRTFREIWQNTLRFTPPSQHGQCDCCASFKESFRHASDNQTKFETAKAYKQHITDVGRDRDLESFLQGQRPLERPGNTLAIHWEPWAVHRYSMYFRVMFFNRLAVLSFQS